jgi:hypothetical protein
LKISTALFLTAFCTILASASSINVAQDKPVTLNGSFPVYTYPGGALCGTNPPQPGAGTVNDGVFLGEGTCYQSGVYWHDPLNSIDIDLQGTFVLDAAIVQADDNDIYTLQYRDLGGVYHDWYNVPTAGSFGLITRPNTADQTQQQSLPQVTATGLRFFAPAGSGDGEFAVSEIQAFGTETPEPATAALMLAGLGGVIAVRRFRRANA